MATSGSESDSPLTAEQQASFAEQTTYNRATALAVEPTLGGFIREDGLIVLSRTLDVVGGVGQIVLGGTICAGVITCAGGGALAAQGASNVYEGWTGNPSMLREGYRKAFGKYGDMAYSAVDVGTSGYGLARPVLKPGSWKLFRYTSDQYIPAARTLTGSQAAIEAAGAANDAASLYRSRP